MKSYQHTLCILLLTSLVTTEENVEILTRNFFANLQEDPHLKGESLNEATKMFIDKLVENYLDLMKHSLGISKHMVTRRSLPIDDLSTLTQDYSGIHILSGFTELYSLEVNYPKDIVLFYHEYGQYKQWYAIALVGEKHMLANTMIIYKLQEYHKFAEIKQIPVKNGCKLAVHKEEQTILVVVAEYNPLKLSFYEEMGVYEFTKNEELKRIQTLNVQYASDVKIWNDDRDLFLSFAQHMMFISDHITYEVKMPVYRWQGKHFDVICEIPTYGAKSITSFMVGKSQFLAVANFQNDYGKTNIYSEILKYNIDTETFKSYQKFLTNAAVDVKHFYFEENNVKEHFLVFANFFELDDDGTPNYETDSIIYKYVEGYFMPFQSFKLNGATEWLPVMRPDNAFVLLVACKFEGVKAFQYNGWKFVESPIQYTSGVFSKGVLAMHSYQFNDKTIVVIANENDHGSMANIYELSFTHRNDLKQFQENMLDWCMRETKTIKDIKIKQLEPNKEQNDEPVLQQEQNAASHIDLKLLETLDIVEPDGTVQEDLNAIKSKIIEQSKKLDAIEKQIQQSLKIEDINSFQGNINIETLVLNSDTSFFKTLNATFINSFDVNDVLSNVVNITDGFAIKDDIRIEEVRIENQFLPEFINGHPVTSLVFTNSNYSLTDLYVNGTVTFKDKLNVHGKVNGMNISKKAASLNTGESLRNFYNDSANLEKLVNNKTFTNIVLSAKKVIVKGFVNNIDIETLHKYALRKSGSQIITGKYTFDSLHVDNLTAKRISGKQIPDDLILTDKGDFEIKHPIKFINDLNATNIIITERLNDIPVVNGKLDVLLSDVPHVQNVRGAKTFENLESQSSIELQGRINSSKLEKLNPVRMINEEIIIKGDYFISGNVTIEQLLQANDIQSASTPTLSIKRLQNAGLRLDDEEIPVHLQFQQELQLDELFVETINGINVSSLIIMDTEKRYNVTGWKQFVGDITILGSTDVTNINGINLKELESNVLKVTGNQTLTGKHHFQTVIANRVSNNKTRIGNNLWENVVTTNTDQKINGTTLIIANSVEIDKIQTKMLSALHINGYDFDTLVNDTILKGQERQILGRKTFPALTVHDLVVKTLDVEQVPEAIESARSTFQLDGNIDLPNDIFIENIFFDSHFNEVPSENFGHQWVFSELEQTIESDQNFDKLIIYGNLFVESGFINDANIVDISENSIKIDEPFHFGTVTFSHGLESLQTISLEGEFESLYLDDIVQSDTRVEQVISGEKIFNNNVIIHGEVHFNGLVSGFNISNLCRFAFSNEYHNEGPHNLYIKGNAYFAKGPIVSDINTVPVKHILENAWFKDRETYITGNLQFEEVIFNQEVTVDGTIDGVQLQQLANTYFSKTKNQNVTALLDFDNDVIFKSGLYATEANVEGEVCGIKLDEFIHTAILDGYDQVFENMVYFDVCEIQDLGGEYLVNQLDLESDVMRYDKPNIVTGHKVIDNVQAKSMILNYNTKVQNVDLLWWLQNTVLKNGTFSISGEVVFQNDTKFSGYLSTQGPVNGIMFNQDTVMLKSVPQNITGNKTLLGDSYFESMILQGFINGVDIMNFLNNQAYKNQNNTFKTPLHFKAEIAASNVNIEKLYQGVNVSRLIHNLTRFASIEDYWDHYEKLLHTAQKVQSSLEAQAYFVDHFEVKQVYKMMHTLIPVSFQNSTDQYLACITEGSQNYTIKFNVWDNEKEHFHHAEDIEAIEVLQELSYIQSIMFQGKEMWYIEYKNNDSNNTNLFKSSVYEVTKQGLIEQPLTVNHNGTKSALGVILPGEQKEKSCIFLLFTKHPLLYCEQEIENEEPSWELYQMFNASNAIEATTSLVQDQLYIIIARKGTVLDEPSIDLWKYDVISKKFNIEQEIYIANPNSINTILYKGTSYLIIASGRLKNAKHAGFLNIYTYNNNLRKFITYQNINLHAPIQTLFAKLPSNELLLYVVTENPAEPLIIFLHEGISGFKQEIVASTLPKTFRIKSFTTPQNRHFVLTENINEMRVMEGVFKGSKH